MTTMVAAIFQKTEGTKAKVGIDGHFRARSSRVQMGNEKKGAVEEGEEGSIY